MLDHVNDNFECTTTAPLWMCARLPFGLKGVSMKEMEAENLPHVKNAFNQPGSGKEDRKRVVGRNGLFVPRIRIFAELSCPCLG